ncbi:hypothetical protein [Halosegnis sp.]|uniref:DUF7523 family protein n=1 Tax=Halosegnis sp. TaxID=2864959 RepID=UPI0035D46E95
MTLASQTRDAVRREPFLRAALAAGVLNYTAAARYLDIGDEEAVAAALRRYAADLEPADSEPTDARVAMQSGVGPTAEKEPLVAVDGEKLASNGGNATALVATGDIGPTDLGRVLARLNVEGVPVRAAGARESHLVCVVNRADGVDALRYVEETLDA